MTRVTSEAVSRSARVRRKKDESIEAHVARVTHMVMNKKQISHLVCSCVGFAFFSHRVTPHVTQTRAFAEWDPGDTAQELHHNVPLRQQYPADRGSDQRPLAQGPIPTGKKTCKSGVRVATVCERRSADCMLFVLFGEAKKRQTERERERESPAALRVFTPSLCHRATTLRR
jgi:hypothetical protein